MVSQLKTIKDLHKEDFPDFDLDYSVLCLPKQNSPEFEDKRKDFWTFHPSDESELFKAFNESDWNRVEHFEAEILRLLSDHCARNLDWMPGVLLLGIYASRTDSALTVSKLANAASHMITVLNISRLPWFSFR